MVPGIVCYDKTPFLSCRDYLVGRNKVACKTETTTINEIEYSCRQYSAIIGAKYKLKVIKAFGASLAAIVPAMSGKTDDQVKALAEAVDKLFKHATPDELIDLLVEMVTSGTVARANEEGKLVILTKTTFEQAFGGDDLADMYKVFIFVLRTNYAGFFKGKKAQELLAKAEATL